MVDTGTLFLQSTTKYTFALDETLAKASVGAPVGLRVFINALRTINCAIRDTLDAELRLTKPKPEQLAEFALNYFELIKEIHEDYLDLIAGADVYPTELLPLAENIVADCTSSFALILRSQTEYMFDFCSLRNLVDHYFNILEPYLPARYRSRSKDFPEWFIVLSFPAIEYHDLLFQTIMLTHEIMHLKEAVEGFSQELRKLIKWPSEPFKEIVNERLDAETRGKTVDAEKRKRLAANIAASLQKECFKVLEDWLTEICSDLLATRLFGPAYFIAYRHWCVGFGGFEDYSSSHPSDALRMKLCLEELDDLGYPNELPDGPFKAYLYTQKTELATYYAEPPTHERLGQVPILL